METDGIIIDERLVKDPSTVPKRETDNIGRKSETAASSNYTLYYKSCSSGSWYGGASVDITLTKRSLVVAYACYIGIKSSETAGVPRSREIRRNGTTMANQSFGYVEQGSFIFINGRAYEVLEPGTYTIQLYVYDSAYGYYMGFTGIAAFAVKAV